MRFKIYFECVLTCVGWRVPECTRSGNDNRPIKSANWNWKLTDRFVVAKTLLKAVPVEIFPTAKNKNKGVIRSGGGSRKSEEMKNAIRNVSQLICCPTADLGNSKANKYERKITFTHFWQQRHILLLLFRLSFRRVWSLKIIIFYFVKSLVFLRHRRESRIGCVL